MHNKKLILFGIVLILLSSLATAWDYNGTSCSDTPGDYIYFNESINEKSGGAFDNQDIPDISNTEDGQITMVFQNFNSTETEADVFAFDPNDGAEFSGRVIANSGGTGNWRTHGPTDMNVAYVADQQYNLTWVYNWQEYSQNLTMNGIDTLNKAFNGNYSMNLIRIYPASTVAEKANFGAIYIWNGTACPTGALPAESSLNVTSGNPFENESFNLATLNFNITANASYQFNCSLYINETLNSTIDNFSSGSNVAVDYNVSFSGKDGNYNYSINCDDGTSKTNSSVNTFYIDSVDPSITWTTPASTNTTTVNSLSNLTSSILISDNNLYSYYYNITTSGGTVLLNWENTSLTGLNSTTISEIIDTGNFSGLHKAVLEVCDGHTANEIQFTDVTKTNNELNFNDVKIYLNNKDDTSLVDYTKLADRYSFDFRTKTYTTMKEFIVESPDYIDILNGKTDYKGHLITGNKWIDFQNDFVDNVIIGRINDNKVKVTVYSERLINRWNFNSIGELNCITETKEFFIYTTNTTYTSSVLSGQSNTFYLNVTTDDSYANVTAATLVYNNTNYYPSQSNNTGHSLLSSTIFAPNVEVEDNVTFYWNYYINSVEFNTSEENQTVTLPVLDNCSQYTTEVLNFTLRNESNEAKIIGNLDIFITYSFGNYSNNFSYNYSGDSSYGVCLTPYWGNVTIDSQMEYYEENSSTKKLYYINDTDVSNVTKLYDLYITDGTTQVKFTVKDQDDEPVSGAIIKVLSYDIDTDTYKTTEVLQSDTSGEAYAQIVLNTQWYQFIIEYEGEVKLQTQPTKITLTSKIFRINLDETDYFEDYNTIRGVSYLLTWTNATTTFSFTWDDQSSTISQGCLKVVRRGINADTTLSDSCTTAYAGNKLYQITEALNANTYIATAYVILENNERYILATRTIQNDETFKTFGTAGLFVTFLLTITLMFIGIWSPVVSILLMVLGLFFSIVLGMFSVGWPALIGIVIMSIIIMYRISK